MDEVMPDSSSRLPGLGAFLTQSPGEPLHDAMLERQVAHEPKLRSHPRRIPLVLARDSGAYVRDTHGKICIDGLSGALPLALGHNHTAAIDSIHTTLDSGVPQHTLATSRVSGNLATRLPFVAAMPGVHVLSSAIRGEACRCR